MFRDNHLIVLLTMLINFATTSAGADLLSPFLILNVYDMKKLILNPN